MKTSQNTGNNKHAQRFTKNPVRCHRRGSFFSFFFWPLHRTNFFEGCGRSVGCIVYSETYQRVGDYGGDGGGDDDDHDERPRRRRDGREREGRMNGASGRTRSAGLRRLSLPVRRPSLLPHRKCGSGSPAFVSPPLPTPQVPVPPFTPLLPLSAQREVRSSDPPLAFVN